MIGNLILVISPIEAAHQLFHIAVKDAVRLLLLVAELGPVLLFLLLLHFVVLVVYCVEHGLSHLEYNKSTIFLFLVK